MTSEEVRQDRMRVIETRAKRVWGVILDPPEQRRLAALDDARLAPQLGVQIATRITDR